MTRFRPAALLLAGLLLTGAGLAVDPATASAQAPAAVTVVTPAGDVTVVADRLEEISADNLLIATGNVEVTRGTQRLTADRVEINRVSGDAVAEGRAIFYDGEDRLTGPRIDYNFKTGSGIVYQGSAHGVPYYRLDGERMERLAEGRYRIRRGIFTTCEDDPPTWSFHFGSADADLESSVFGTSAGFWVKNVPVIPFFPFFAAAIRRERQTGFLFPRFGDSSRKGYYAEIPFFWAISDSQDATVTLNLYEKIGVGLNLDYRFILSRTHSGLVRGFYINESEKPEALRREPPGAQPPGIDTEPGVNRGWWTVKDNWILGGGWSLVADVNGVSDDLLFRDYGDPLQTRAAQRVESNIFVTRGWSTSTLVTNFFWYQDLTTPRAVELQRLPDIRYNAPRQPIPGLPEELRLLGDVEASATNFVREVGSDGQRADVHPRLSRAFSPGGFFTVTPFVGGRLTGYDRTHTGFHTSRDGTVYETVSDDARLRRLVELGSDFEARASRVYEVGGIANVDGILHSIEPRVNYTWIDGSDLLVPTGRGAFTPNRLPQWDGIDTVPETSLITYSLTNRLRARTVAPPGTEPTRWELTRFVLSQTYDLHNDVRPFGNVTADLIIDPARYFQIRSAAAYNIYGEGLKSVTNDLVVTVPRFEASVGTRLLRDRFVTHAGDFDNRVTEEFYHATVRADVLRWMTARLETNWDAFHGVVIENRVGVDLRWQCWAFSVDYVTRHNSEDELRFSLNLLGLGQPLQFGSRLAGTSSAVTGANGRIQ